jgi:hypothetical protein
MLSMSEEQGDCQATRAIQSLKKLQNLAGGNLLRNTKRPSFFKKASNMLIIRHGSLQSLHDTNKALHTLKVIKPRGRKVRGQSAGTLLMVRLR